MTTTKEKYADARRGNYCTLPIHDVEILPDEHHCEKCGETVIYDPDKGYFGEWVHEDPFNVDHRADIKVRCPYCHSEDDAVYRQHPWHDAVECSRCGGVDGRAIGD